MSLNESEQKPLDPEAAQVVARVQRMMMIAGATTLIALAAVFGVIGYRIFKSGGSAPASAAPPVAVETAALPAGARVVATAVADGRIVVTVEAGGATEILTFDARTLKPAGRLMLRAAP